MTARWRRWQARSLAERMTFIEAMVMLALASAAVRLVAFRRIARFASLRVAGRPPTEADRIVTRVAWAVRAAGDRAPFRAVCIERGLAAQAMLRRRGVSTVLHYGARIDPGGGMAAHVWVVHGATDVTGGAEAAGFSRLASFPDDVPPREN